MQLPKSSSGLPKEERDPKQLGGAFKDYGGNRQGGRWLELDAGVMPVQHLTCLTDPATVARLLHVIVCCIQKLIT